MKIFYIINSNILKKKSLLSLLLLNYCYWNASKMNVYYFIKPYFTNNIIKYFIVIKCKYE